MLAYGQNGEMLRPEQGYPLRLLLPGYEGNTHIKWLRRIEVSDKPFMSREETSKYTDLLNGGKARQFSFTMEAKSVITYPSGEMKLPGAGFYELTGLAWSGRGKVRRVDISTDGGATWGDEIRLRDDGGYWDVGYTRSVERPDGQICTVYYFTDGKLSERYIASTIWDPRKVTP